MLPLSPSLPLLPLNIPPSPTEIQGYVHHVDSSLTNRLGNWNTKMREVDAKFHQIMEENSNHNSVPVETEGDLDSMTAEQMKLEIQSLRRRNLRLRNELTAWQMRAEFAEKASTSMAAKLESLEATSGTSHEMALAMEEQLSI